MKKRYLAEEQKKYINGLKRYESRGIPIYIDGEMPNDSDWEKIFQIQEDGSFYMCDYVGAGDGKLKEIQIEPDHDWCNSSIAELNLPQNILIALIKRGDENIIPQGGAVIHPGDQVVIYK